MHQVQALQQAASPDLCRAGPRTTTSFTLQQLLDSADGSTGGALSTCSSGESVLLGGGAATTGGSGGLQEPLTATSVLPLPPAAPLASSSCSEQKQLQQHQYLAEQYLQRQLSIKAERAWPAAACGSAHHLLPVDVEAGQGGACRCAPSGAAGGGLPCSAAAPLAPHGSGPIATLAALVRMLSSRG